MGLSWGSRGSAAPLLSYLFTAGSVRPRFPLREWDWGGVRWALQDPPPPNLYPPPSPVGRGVPVVPVVPASPAALGPPPSHARPSAPMGWSQVWGGGSRGWGRPPPWGGAATTSPSPIPCPPAPCGVTTGHPMGTHHSGEASGTRLPRAARGSLGTQRGGSAGGDAPHPGDVPPQPSPRRPSAPSWVGATYDEPRGSLPALGSHGAGVALRKAAG